MRETVASSGLDAAVEAALRDYDYGRWRGLAMATAAASEPSRFCDKADKLASSEVDIEPDMHRARKPHQRCVLLGLGRRALGVAERKPP